ncbi:MAG: hypothetical protein NTU47_18820 [Ignavibacteriales bacterium]|nr:hypothetical protein [Ignavibacteriales bacterium]
MPEQSTQSKKLQWKWIGISMVMYALFYLLPLILLANVAGVLASVWLFAGVIIISGVAGFLSKEVTILEPAIAGVGLVVLFGVGSMLFIPRQINIGGMALGTVILSAGVFLLSILGSWFGERAQKLWMPKSPEEAPNQ